MLPIYTYEVAGLHVFAPYQTAFFPKVEELPVEWAIETSMEGVSKCVFLLSNWATQLVQI